MHPPQRYSLGYAALGILESESLILHRMRKGLTRIRGIAKKHATKQIDSLLSNKKPSVWELSGLWARYLIGEAKELLVALDWSAFASDSQTKWLSMVSRFSGEDHIQLVINFDFIINTPYTKGYP